MKEEYKFVGFVSDIELYARVERYGNDLLRDIFEALPDSNQWSITEYISDSGLDKQELVQKRFAVSPDAVIVGCHNTQSSKGARVQIHDPTAEGGAELNEKFRVSLTERPALLSAFMDELGEEGCVRFSRDLVITCELTNRTEALARGLIRQYLVDGLSYDAMASYAQEVSDQEAQLWKKWTSKHPSELR